MYIVVVEILLWPVCSFSVVYSGYGYLWRRSTLESGGKVHNNRNKSAAVNLVSLTIYLLAVVVVGDYDDDAADDGGDGVEEDVVAR